VTGKNKHLQSQATINTYNHR